MNNRTARFATLTSLLVLALAVAAFPAEADSFDVSLDTSSLSGTQILAFGFVDGDGVVDNTVTLSDFSFGGGNPVGSPDYLGTTGVSGDLSSTVSMDDSGLTALFTQEFDPGSTLSFLLTTTNNFAGTTPDAFSMSVCDTSFNCYSDATDTSAMLVLNLTGTPLSPSSFLLYGASAQGLPAPVVTGTTPEPPSIVLLAVGMLGLAVFQRKCRDALGG